MLDAGRPGLVSCIIAARDAAAYIGCAVDSVLTQSYAPIEIVIVDDGSTDGTGDLMRSRFGERIILIRQDSKGVARARNAGIMVSSGAYIGFLDADDLWPAERTEKLVDALDKNAAWTGSHLFWINHWDNAELAKADQYKNPDLASVQKSLVLCAGLYRRSIFWEIGLFDPRYTYCSESEWLLRARDAGHVFGRLEEIGYQRRIHGANMSRGKNIKHEMVQIISERLKRRQSARKE